MAAARLRPAPHGNNGSALHRVSRQAGARIDLVDPQAGLPDLVFTANAAVVLDGKALLARFRQRQAVDQWPAVASRLNPAAGRGESLAAVRRAIW